MQGGVVSQGVQAWLVVHEAHQLPDPAQLLGDRQRRDVLGRCGLELQPAEVGSAPLDQPLQPGQGRADGVRFEGLLDHQIAIGGETRPRGVVQ